MGVGEIFPGTKVVEDELEGLQALKKNNKKTIAIWNWFFFIFPSLEYLGDQKARKLQRSDSIFLILQQFYANR